MFWWIFNALLGSISGIFWKKSLNRSNVPENIFYAIGMTGALILSLGVFFLGSFHIPSIWWMIGIPIIDAFIVIYNSKLQQRMYKEEKISTLLPYENLSSVLTIVAAFFLFRDTPFWTLVIAIVTIAVMFFSSFDFKTHEFPKNLKLLIVSNSITAGRSLYIAFAFHYLTNATFYASRNLSSTLMIFFSIFLAGQLGTFRQAERNFLIPRLSASFLWAVSSFIGFALVAHFGLVTSTLLGFLSMGTTLLLGYFFLHDTPTRKNVILACVVAVLVAVGTILKTY